MWKFALRATQLGDIRKLLSPKFFRVFPTSKIRDAVGELYSNYRDGERFDRAVERRADSLEVAEVPVRIDPELEPHDSSRHDHGAAVLELYFHQLFEEGAALLDLRRARFEARDRELEWSPTALYVDWEEDFLEGLRAMYRGFYLDDDRQFQQGLRELNLQGVGEILLEHFGEGDQRAVTFEMDHFRESFDELLVRCDREDRSLHHQFAPLGVYLATLYEHLEQLGGAHDVRGAFDAVHG